jgi:hypothetical protein
LTSWFRYHLPHVCHEIPYNYLTGRFCYNHHHMFGMGFGMMICYCSSHVRYEIPQDVGNDYPVPVLHKFVTRWVRFNLLHSYYVIPYGDLTWWSFCNVLHVFRFIGGFYYVSVTHHTFLTRFHMADMTISLQFFTCGYEIRYDDLHDVFVTHFTLCYGILYVVSWPFHYSLSHVG